VPYGVLFSVELDCLGLCLDKEWICLLVGEGCLADVRAKRCGRWCHHAFCGVFSGEEMIDVLRTVVELKSFLFITHYLWTFFFLIARVAGFCPD